MARRKAGLAEEEAGWSHPWPAPWDNPRLVGHATAERALLDAFNSGKLPHAWLIAGPRGIGKSTLAHRFARFLLAGDHGGGLFGGAPDSLAADPDSPAARRMAAGGHADFRRIERGINERTGKRRTEIVVDDVRDLGHFMRLTPAEGGWRVALVDAADEMNRNAANALLKVLEEPPARAVLLLVAHAPGRLLPTIRSRCRTLSLRPLPEADAAALVGQWLPDTAPEERTALAHLAGGSVGRALDLAASGSLDLYREMVRVLGSLPRLDAVAAHAFAERVARRGDEGELDWRNAAFLLDWWLQELLRVGAAGDAAGGADTPQERELRARLLAVAGLDRWLAAWEKVGFLFARADAVNLDRKQATLGAFFALQEAMRA